MAVMVALFLTSHLERARLQCTLLGRCQRRRDYFPSRCCSHRIARQAPYAFNTVTEPLRDRPGWQNRPVALTLVVSL
jgi:hypothetical protein